MVGEASFSGNGTRQQGQIAKRGSTAEQPKPAKDLSRKRRFSKPVRLGIMIAVPIALWTAIYMAVRELF